MNGGKPRLLKVFMMGQGSTYRKLGIVRQLNAVPAMEVGLNTVDRCSYNNEDNHG